MAFAPSCQARLPVVPFRAFRIDAADFASCCRLVGCTFLIEGSTPRCDARISPHAGGLLQRDLLLLSPDLHRLVVVNLRTHHDSKIVDGAQDLATEA